jgi:putative flippase GtrA
MGNPATRSDPAPAQAIAGRLRPGITHSVGGPPYRFARNSLLKNAKVKRVAHGKNGRVIKAAVVGAIGTAISTLALYLLSRWSGLPLAAASALAVELAAVSNYLLTDSWTLAARRPTFRRFAKFNVAVLMGLALNVFTVWFLARLGLYFLAANLLGIAFGFIANDSFSASWVWGRAI